MIGLPPLSAACHVITVLSCCWVVVGAVGVFGMYAVRMLNCLEKTLVPSALRA